MSLLEKPFSQFENDGQLDVLETPKSVAEEMTISSESVVRHRSTMKEEIKQLKRKTMGSLEELLAQVVHEKGEDHVKVSRDKNEEMVVEGLSSTALHSFVLKAEEIGKNITYTKTFTVKISD